MNNETDKSQKEAEILETPEWFKTYESEWMEP